jgi:polyprenyl P-hydroxybenzoate/phenylacrylic acid decarboxylase-like protein
VVCLKAGIPPRPAEPFPVPQRLVIGISGSSAPVYGVRLLEVLAGREDVETHLIISRAARRTIPLELEGWTADGVSELADVVYPPEDIAAAVSSGSFRTLGMVIAPCSMKTLAGVAHSLSLDLLLRAADVTLKERRPLVLLPRETPLHLGHLRNMLAVTEMGGIILPPVPAFYHRPNSIDDLVNHTAGKVLDLLGIEHTLFERWKGPPKEEA